MARVVRRRKNPLLPILLIFVFLFLIASVMAVMHYNGQEDAQKKLKIARNSSLKIASPEELGDPVISKIISEYDKSPPGKKGPTVVAELIKRNNAVTDKIAGEKLPGAIAIKRIESTIGETAYLLDVIDKERAATAAETAKIRVIEAQIKELEAQKIDANATIATTRTTYETKAAAEAAKTRTLEAANTTLSAEHQTALGKAAKKSADELAQKDQAIDRLTAKLNKITVERDKLKVRNDILARLVIKKKKSTPRDLTIREAGRIKEIMADRNVCFVPVGSQDRVVRGMTFRVYGPEGIPNDGEGHKAALTVTRVYETISQCRVSPVDDKDPVAIGDSFANIAFDPSRQPIFFVEGLFNLSGTGRLSRTGTQEIISLIKRSGGKVVKKLSVDVDFVVMGPEPSRPAELDEDAPGTAKKAWEIRMEAYKRWRQTLDKAIALNVPKLNTRRFLTLTGYNAVKEYQD